MEYPQSCLVASQPHPQHGQCPMNKGGHSDSDSLFIVLSGGNLFSVCTKSTFNMNSTHKLHIYNMFDVCWVKCVCIATNLFF